VTPVSALVIAYRWNCPPARHHVFDESPRQLLRQRQPSTESDRAHGIVDF